MIVVEHDPDVIQTADHIIDIGPNAGKDGGEIMFEGSYQDLLTSQTSTGQALNRTHQLKDHPRATHDMFNIENISRNNLNHISTQLPKHAMTVVTGVAGSGKVPLSQQPLNKSNVLSSSIRNRLTHRIALIYSHT